MCIKKTKKIDCVTRITCFQVIVVLYCISVEKRDVLQMGINTPEHLQKRTEII